MLSVLSYEELLEVKKLLECWGMRFVKDSKLELSIESRIINSCRNLFMDVNETLFNSMTEVCPWLVDDKEARGAACAAFIGCQIFKGVLRLDNPKDELDVPLILLYLISDFIMDDKSIDGKIKKQLTDVFNNNPEDFINSDLDIKVRATLDQFMILTISSPNSRQELLKTWHYEVECEKQKSGTSTLEELWDMSCEKGALTTMMAYSTMMDVKSCDKLHKDNVESVRTMGAITQLLDDLMDHQTDKDEGIDTAALMSMRRGELDKYVRCVLIKIGTLSNDLLSMKVFFTQILCACAGHNMDCSEEIRNLLLNNCISDNRYNLVEFVDNLR